MENEYRVATCWSTSVALSAKNRASVEILSLKVSLQCSSTNRVVEFVRREFPDVLDDESTACVRKVPKLAV